MHILRLLLPLAALAAAPPDEHPLEGFEDAARPPLFEAATGAPPVIAPDHATQGRQALRISSTSYLTSWRFPRDWSGFDSLEADAFNDTGAPVAVSLLVADQPWQDKGRTYWNRHNSGMNLLPGAGTISIPVEGLYRGEAGSRNNDLQTNIDPRAIVRVDLGFAGRPGSVFLDHFRLVRRRIPNDFHAFDFGPASQTVWPGFTPVTWDSVWDGNKGYGLSEKQPGSSYARDDTFPTRLFSDWLWIAQGTFNVHLPRGRWRAWAVFNDCGYWGGEHAKHRKRVITVDGGIAWQEDRSNTPGDDDALYRFENVEPKPGQDPAHPYYDALFAPREFTFETLGDPAKFGFVADAPMSAKLAALIIIPADAGTLWVAGVLSANRDEYRSRAVEDRAASDRSVHVPGSLAPPPVTAARGDTASFEFTIVPDRDADPPRVIVSPLRGTMIGGGTSTIGSEVIDPSAVTVRVVRNLMKRGYNSLGWAVTPAYLDDPESTPLIAGIARRFRVTVSVRSGVSAAEYHGFIKVIMGPRTIEIPIALTVLSLRLDEPDFPIALYGMRTDWLEFLRGYGFTGLSGGPEVQFTGWDDRRQPRLDFAAADEYFARAKALGYRGPVIAYGGPGNLAELRYESVEDRFTEWGRPANLGPAEAARRILNAWRDHAKTAGWPEIYWPMADEPRVAEQTDRIISSVRFLNQVAPWLKLSGSYSVDWTKGDPLRHQRLFAALDASWLNEHHDRDFREAKALGRTIGIYNQGRDRYTFGVNLFAERRRGVAAFCQWHASAVHGYQFYDLDGREPDDALVIRTTRGLRPTVALEEIGAGITDLRWLITLERLARGRRAAGKPFPAAEQFLRELTVPDRANSGKSAATRSAIRTSAISHVQSLTGL